MKHIVIIITVFICSATEAMDTQEELRKQLFDIVFNGQYNTFKQQQETFTKELCYADFHRAYWRCASRLLALESLKAMESNPRIKELVTTMQKELKRYKYGVFAYISEAEEKKCGKIPEEKDEFNTAASIINDIELRATSFTGNYLIDLMTKTEQEPEPDRFLEKETQNTTQLRDNLQAILNSEFEPARVLLCRQEEAALSNAVIFEP